MKGVDGCADHIETHEDRGVLANKAIALVDLWSGAHHTFFMQAFCKVLLGSGAWVAQSTRTPKNLALGPSAAFSRVSATV